MKEEVAGEEAADGKVADEKVASEKIAVLHAAKRKVEDLSVSSL